MQINTAPGKSASVIHAIVVAFNPDERLLPILLTKLAAQCARIHIIDNTPGSSWINQWIFQSGLGNAEPHALGENVGIAGALNIGIHQALAQGATHVLLSDQDSLPSDDLVSGLLGTWEDLTAHGVRVGAVGPVCLDEHTSIELPFQVEIPGKFLYGHARPNKENPTVETLTLITSGSLIATKALKEIGDMREDFFIDHVDIEWCHRARAHGFRLFGTSNARIFHRMGEASLRVWYFGWRYESAYPPLRTYYRIRNFVVLAKNPNIAVSWRIRNGWCWLGFLYSQIFFGKSRLASLRMGLLGLWDGVRNKLGPYGP